MSVSCRGGINENENEIEIEKTIDCIHLDLHPRVSELTADQLWTSRNSPKRPGFSEVRSRRINS